MRSNVRKRPEEAEQIAFFDYCRIMAESHPAYRLAFAIPNERKCSIQRRISMKKAGVRSGVPDIFIPAPNLKYSGLFIEMKVKPNRPTPEQLAMLSELSRQNYYTVICWSAEEAIEIINKYIKNVL
jgi:hypothetical protein